MQTLITQCKKAPQTAKNYACEALAALYYVIDTESAPVELLSEAAAVVLQRPEVLAIALQMYINTTNQ